jgi:hypothetical protein
MDRPIVYAGAIPQDTDLLNTNKDAMIGLGMFAQAILGTTTVYDGLICAPTAPATMTVNVGPGSIYSQQNIDGSAYGSLAPDTTDQIVKQGIVFGETNFSCPAPATSGFSVAYLIEASYQDQDGGSTVLPYYNASNPAVAYNGPNNSGTSQNTVRKGVCVLTLKAGTAAATGTQITPATDVGAVSVAVITVANGQSTITSGSIFQFTGSLITPKLTGILAALQSGAAIYAADSSGAANTITISLSPAVSALAAGQRINVKVANTNTGATVINTNGLGNVAAITQDGNPLPPGAVKANGVYTFIYDGASWQFQAPQGGDLAVGQCVFQYTSATVVTLAPKNGNRVAFPNGTMQSIGGGVTATYNNCSINGTSGQTLAASTLYYAYLVAGSSPFLDFSTTAYSVDSTSGINIKTGDAARVLVGRLVTNGSGQFLDQDGFRQVYSWFNKQRKRSRTNFTAPRSTSSSSFVEPNTEIRNFVAPWSGDLVDYFITGGVSNSSTGTNVTGIGFDGTSAEPETSSIGVGTTSNGTVAIAGNKSGLTEALHYATLLGMTNSGTSTWQSTTSSSAGETVLNLVVLG